MRKKNQTTVGFQTGGCGLLKKTDRPQDFVMEGYDFSPVLKS